MIENLRIIYHLIVLLKNINFHQQMFIKGADTQVIITRYVNTTIYIFNLMTVL